MTPTQRKKELGKLEKSLIDLSGDHNLARRICRDAEMGIAANSATLRSLESAVKKRSSDPRLARRLCADLPKALAVDAPGVADPVRRLTQRFGSVRGLGGRFPPDIEKAILEELRQLSAKQLGALMAARNLRQGFRVALLNTIAKLPANDIAEALIEAKRADWVNDPDKPRAVLVERGTGCAILKGPNEPLWRFKKRTYPRRPPVDKKAFVGHANRFEEVIPYMYQDDEGHVTVGIGHLIPDSAAAAALPFVWMRSTTPANQRNIEEAFDAVKNATLLYQRAIIIFGNGNTDETEDFFVCFVFRGKTF